MVKFLMFCRLLRPFMCDALLKNYHAAGILALNLSNDIVYVRELDQYSIWKRVSGKMLPLFLILNIYSWKKNREEESNEINGCRSAFNRAFNYIMVKGYIFLGVLYLDVNASDSNILTDGVLWKKKMILLWICILII